MPDNLPTRTPLQRGTVARLNLRAGFGYVRDESAEHAYIFVVGKGVKHSDARRLSVGAPVMFLLTDAGKVQLFVGE